jgi:enhancin-like peptidase M60 family/peptidase M60-like protein
LIASFAGCSMPSMLFHQRVLRYATTLLLIASSAALGFGFAERGDHDADLDALLARVRTIGRPGIPGPLAVTGPDAFVVWTGRVSGELALPIAVAARHGEGRTFALGHTGYFSDETLEEGDTAQLLVNAARWLGGAKPRICCWRQPELADTLSAAGLEVESVSERDWMTSLDRVDVVFLKPSTLDSAEVERLREWVAAGGGAGFADLGWGWQQLNPRRVLSEDHPGNLFGAPLGFVWADGTFRSVDPVTEERGDLQLASAAYALHALRERDQVEESAPLSPQLGGVLTSAVRAVPARDQRLLAPLEEWLGDRRLAVPTAAAPLGPNEVAARLSIVVSHRRAAALPPAEVRPAPSAATFPGSVPESAKRRRGARVMVAGVRGERVTTGLYAAPGDVIDVRLEADQVRAGLHLRIGAHSDELWHRPRWERHPEISAKHALDRALVSVASPHGGALYIELSRDLDDALEVTIDGAVSAPRFTLGRTTANEWRKSRRAPAPWAELESEHIVLSVPSSTIRSLDDPTKLLELWDRVMLVFPELDRRPLARRRERIVPDVDISAGYMHSGYPVMTHLDAAPWLVDHDRLLGRPEPQVWGLWHELGHNRQHTDWTFDGTVEVTCNLYTLFVLDRISGVAPIDHPRIGPLQEKFEAYVAAGADFAQWKREPFLALYTYVQLQEAFGWESFQGVFQAYLELEEAERPRGDAAKRDLWLVMFSRAVERDLSSFFELWGVPTSREARESVAGLEAWLP